MVEEEVLRAVKLYRGKTTKISQFPNYTYVLWYGCVYLYGGVLAALRRPYVGQDKFERAHFSKHNLNFKFVIS